MIERHPVNGLDQLLIADAAIPIVDILPFEPVPHDAFSDVCASSGQVAVWLFATA